MLRPEGLRQQVTEEGAAERFAVNSTRTRRGSNWKAKRFDGKEARNVATVGTWMRQCICSSRWRERKTEWEQGEVAGIAISRSKPHNSKCRIRILSRTQLQECWVYYWDSTIGSEGGDSLPAGSNPVTGIDGLGSSQTSQILRHLGATEVRCQGL
jgi:hypothetical protein